MGNEIQKLKKMYFAGSMIIDPKTEQMDLTRDYRTFLVDSKKILMPFDPIPLNDEYAYAWPSFYYADDQDKPSLSSKLIIDKEWDILPNVDVLVAFLQEKMSAGTLSEVMLASMFKRPTHVYYTPSPTESDVYNTNQWYPLLMAQKLNPDNVKVSEVTGLTDLLRHLKSDFGINPIRWPEQAKEGGRDNV